MLKALMLKRQIDLKRNELKTITDKKAELEKRQAELESAIAEVETEDEQRAVEEAVTAYEGEVAENEAAEKKLNDEIRELETQLAEEEKEQETEAEQPVESRTENKKEVMTMTRDFYGMNAQERDAFIQRDDVQGFLKTVRSAMAEKRAISNAGYLVPEVMLGLLRDNIADYSKLYKHVDVRRINGKGRLVIEGTVPEAVWTEACANLNELDLSFSKVEIDEFKCGGYFKVCNSTLADSDIDLAAELMRVLGQAIGYALDKAIVYGTGVKMPTGIVTALAAVQNTPNIFSIAASVTGVALFQAILTDFSAAGHTHSNGDKVWAMNETTYNKLLVQAMSINASGAIVSGMEKTMPVIGGAVEILSFMPDNVIVAGYGDMFLLAERRGIELSTSEHAFWTADQTGFKGTARYDGKVLDSDAFVAIGINAVTPAANDVSFASDTAN